MNARLIIYVFFLLPLAACLKAVPVHDVIQIQPKSLQLLANGVSRDTIYGYMPYDATPDKRVVSFQTGTGLFDNGKDTMTIVANRNDIKANTWTAVAYLTSSLRAGPDTIIAKANLSLPYIDSAFITLLPSNADSISLSASSFSVKVNFGSDITITGKLFNSAGYPVSLGNRVTFTDFYVGGAPVNGSYRQLQDSSDINSQVSVIYSPGMATPSSFIFVKATITPVSGMPTPHPDSVQIFITP